MLSNFFSGQIISINKPYHKTSFQAVNKLKWAIKQYLKNNPEEGVDKNSKIKVGHAGTLDPLATGLLLICTGKKTKEISILQDLEKEYTGTFFLGATTPCFDLELKVDATFPTEHITEELIYATAKKFIGVQQQEPPIFSAVKINGERAYDKARKGEIFEVRSKQIEIKEFEITRIAMPEVEFRIVCTKGTYIRSIARDFAKAMGSGAHLTALCRTKIGNYKSEDAHNLETLVNQLISKE